MNEWVGIIIEQVQQNSALELIAVLAALAYLILAVKENVLCWPAALISTFIFLFVPGSQ